MFDIVTPEIIIGLTLPDRSHTGRGNLNIPFPVSKSQNAHPDVLSDV
jgi:hypothetical protein